MLRVTTKPDSRWRTGSRAPDTTRCYRRRNPGVPAGGEDELGLLGEHPQRGEQVLHGDRAHLALRGLPLPDPGVRGGGRARVEGRPEGLRVQHPAARLRERLLRPLLPHLAGAPVGAAAHRGVHAVPAGGPARGLPGAPRGQAPPPAVPGQGQPGRRAVRHLRAQPALQGELRGRLPAGLLLRVRRLRGAHAPALQREPVPQHGGLLHRQGHGEEDLPLHHGRHLPAVHRPQPGGAGLHRVEAPVEVLRAAVRARGEAGAGPGVARARVHRRRVRVRGARDGGGGGGEERAAAPTLPPPALRDPRRPVLI